MRRNVIAVFIVMLTIYAGNVCACYSIVAGKKTTADGSVLFGHNEDNARKFVAGLWKVERENHDPGDFVRLQSGGRIAQAPTTFGYWWLQMPELDYSDGLLNEFGVAVATDNCPSREDNPVLTDGGIGGPILRRLVVERAKTAREGVILVGSLVERFGYTASGRTMVICDPNEGWLVSIVNGKHWVAQRVPDDKVAIIANTYTIREIDLADTLNFLGSKDIVAYARARGWYDPSEGDFSFEKAYAAPTIRVSPGNTHRQWSGLRRIAKNEVPLPETERLPFAVIPKEKLTIRHIAEVLRDHYEGTPYETNDNYADTPAHKRHTTTICSPATNSSSIFQLRTNMPVVVGAVWWIALWQPCSTPYVPLYCGAAAVPSDLGFNPETSGTCPYCVVSPEFGVAYKTFAHLSAWVDTDYAARIDSVSAVWRTMEASSIGAQKAFEAFVLDRLKNDQDAARDILTRYSAGSFSFAVRKAQEFLAVETSVPEIR